MHLIVNYYVETNEFRRREIDDCLSTNAISPWIDFLTVMVAANTSLPIIPSEKIAVVSYSPEHLSGRPTFRQLFAASRPECINVIANNDIVFDPSLRCAEVMQADECYALTRWDLEAGKPRFFGSLAEWSQDAWIFRGNPRSIVFSDFPQGYPGCDNRLAYELRLAGYRINNPSFTIRALHQHDSGYRNGPSNDLNSPLRIPGPYLGLPPRHLQGPAAGQRIHRGIRGGYSRSGT